MGEGPHPSACVSVQIVYPKVNRPFASRNQGGTVVPKHAHKSHSSLVAGSQATAPDPAPGKKGGWNHTPRLGVTGLEHSTQTPIKPHVSSERGTESGTLTPELGLPSDLLDVIDAWPTLPQCIRDAIKALVANWKPEVDCEA